MQPTIAIIGGSRLEKYLSESSVDVKISAFYKSHCKQADKQFSAKEIRVNSNHILFVNRYSVGLSEGKAKYHPHEVDYKTIMAGLYQCGIKKIISVNKCGSLQRDMKPGTITVFKDFIDTVNRDITLDDLGVEVADMTVPFDTKISGAIEEAAKSESIRLGPGTTYILCVDGSRMETPAEIELFKSLFKKDLVFGMEVPTEAQLAKILGIDYAAFGVITNYATGLRKEKITQSLIEGHFEKSLKKLAILLFRTVGVLSAGNNEENKL